MMDTLRFILSSQLKRSRLVHPISGFTLIELLIAMVLAVLVITPLLGFMVNILSTDRQEQAKANSEQEVQAALDYITRDIQQAVYVYGSTAVESVKASLPTSTVVNQVPVLVFWKRNLLKNAVDSQKNDTFVYSLVAYYLIRDKTPNSSIWSNAARIARWEIKDGILTGSTTGNCPGYDSSFCPSPGLGKLIKNQSISVLDNLKSWQTDGTAYTDALVPLVDFIDHTTGVAAPVATCPPGYAKLPSSSVDTLQMTGFYACVDEPNTTAQIYLRGNALMRLQNTSDQVYSVNKSNYFPSANALIQGRSYLFTK
jgi:prepilin-type N-terminal cleavage/methylation domain-containing protein